MSDYADNDADRVVLAKDAYRKIVAVAKAAVAQVDTCQCSCEACEALHDRVQKMHAGQNGE